MDNVRNLHTFVPDEYGDPVLSSVDLVGSVDTGAAQNWGLYQGDPAAKVSGDMGVWDPGGDPEEDPGPYTESWVKTTGCHVWYDASEGDWYHDKTVQVGLIYEGDDIGEVSVNIRAGFEGDGYYAVFVTYPLMSPAPQVVWLVGASYVPPEPPGPFWTSFIGSHEII